VVMFVIVDLVVVEGIQNLVSSMDVLNVLVNKKI